MTNPHLDTPTVVIGPSLLDASVVVVAVHGRGQTPEYLVEHVVRRIDGDHIAWLLPAAHESSWYPLGFLAPIEENQPRLDQALAAIDQIAGQCARLPAERIVWLGFSQGACLVSEWVARHPRRWGGLVALTGGRIGPPGTDLAIDVAGSGFYGMPAYFGVGDADEWVPVGRVEDTAAAFRAAGAAVTMEVFPGRPHEISTAEILRAIEVIDSARR